MIGIPAAILITFIGAWLHGSKKNRPEISQEMLNTKFGNGVRL